MYIKAFQSDLYNLFFEKTIKKQLLVPSDFNTDDEPNDGQWPSTVTL